MDMYQKRKMRKNKKMDENEKSLPSTCINCDKPTLINFQADLDFIILFI